MENVQKPSNSECGTPSEPFRINKHQKDFRTLHNDDELPNLYSSPKIIIIKSRRCVEHVAKRDAWRFW
jgi:hypothetical protein